MIFHFTNTQVHFVFCSLNFIILFPYLIKYYRLMFIIIVFSLGSDRPSGPSLGSDRPSFDRPSGSDRPFFFRAHFTSFHTHASLLTYFVCFFVLFHSCGSNAPVFGKTLVHEFPLSYRNTEWYLIFFAR